MQWEFSSAGSVYPEEFREASGTRRVSYGFSLTLLKYWEFSSAGLVYPEEFREASGTRRVS